MNERVAVVYNPDILSLDFGEGHPLRSDRYSNFISLFNKLGLDRSPQFEVVGCQPATVEDLLLVHSADYIKEVDKAAAEHGYLSVDTPVNAAVVKGAMLAVGGALEAGRLIADGKNRHALCFGGFHHAGRDYGGGFCVFNDVAILAKALEQRHGKKRVMIIDTDAHTGDGTQEILADDPQTLVVTMQQDPRTIYPGRGFPHQLGEGPGAGHTVNIPLPLNSGIDQYERVFEDVVYPLVKEFRPEVVIRNGGSDPHYADELTALGLSVADFKALGAMVRKSLNGAPLIDIYGSGYNPVVLPYCWMSMLSGTSGVDIEVPTIIEGRRREIHLSPGSATQMDLELGETLADLFTHLGPFWKCFQ